MDLKKLLRKTVWVYQSGDSKTAKKELLKILVNEADNTNVCQLLATLEHQFGNHQNAINYFARSKSRMSGHAFWHTNYANLLKDMRRYYAAKQSYQHSLKLDKTFEQAWNGLGEIAKLEEDNEALIKIYQDALKAIPNSEVIHCNLARVYIDQDQHEKAEPILQNGIQLAKLSQNTRLLELMSYDLARVMENKKTQSTEILDFLLPVLPKLHTDHAGRIALKAATLQVKTQRWDGLGSMINVLHKRIKEGEITYEAWNTLSLPGLTEAEHLKMAQDRTNAQLDSEAKPLSTSSPKPIKDRPLRLGIVSGDLVHPHPVYNVLIKTLESFDSARIEMFLYSTYFNAESEQEYPHRHRVSACVAKLIDVADYDDQRLALTIYEDKIDVILDLSGHTAHNRIAMYAWKPAPVTVSWLGYPGTAGSKYHDYILGDKYVCPDGCESNYSETIWRMPNTFFPTDNSRPLSDAPTKREAGLPEDKFIFACFSNGYKINPPVFTAWCEILRHTPNSVLWLRRPKEADPQNLLSEAKKRNIEPERIIFAERAPSMVEHWSRIQLADLALDTTPYNMHATAVDFLWAGVPVLTVKGETFAGRVGESLLNAANMPDLVAKDWQDYVNKAVYIANKPDVLLGLKKRVWQAKGDSSLFDTKQMAHDLEDAFFAMYNKAVENV